MCACPSVSEKTLAEDSILTCRSRKLSLQPRLVRAFSIQRESLMPRTSSSLGEKTPNLTQRSSMLTSKIGASPPQILRKTDVYGSLAAMSFENTDSVRSTQSAQNVPESLTKKRPTLLTGIERQILHFKLSRQSIAALGQVYSAQPPHISKKKHPGKLAGCLFRSPTQQDPDLQESLKSSRFADSHPTDSPQGYLFCSLPPQISSNMLGKEKKAMNTVAKEPDHIPKQKANKRVTYSDYSADSIARKLSIGSGLDITGTLGGEGGVSSLKRSLFADIGKPESASSRYHQLLKQEISHFSNQEQTTLAQAKSITMIERERSNAKEAQKAFQSVRRIPSKSILLPPRTKGKHHSAAASMRGFSFGDIYENQSDVAPRTETQRSTRLPRKVSFDPFKFVITFDPKIHQKPM